MSFPQFPAYRQNSNRSNTNFPPDDYRRRSQNHNHNEPFADLPDFSASIEVMHRSLEARQREERERNVRMQIEERVRREQDRSIYSVIQPTLGDDDDDDEDEYMGNRSAFDPVPSARQEVIVIIKEKSKKKKHKKDKKKKHKKRSSSTSSSDTSESHKKKKRQHSLDDYSLGEGTSQQKRIRIDDSPFHAKNNTWKMLRKSEYVYMPSHMVIDNRGDLTNLQYDKPYQYELVDYRSFIKPNALLKDIHAISMKLKELISQPSEIVAKNDQRVHSIKFRQRWSEFSVERNFRNQSNKFDDYIPLSHQPFVEDDDEAASRIKKELDAGKLQSMNINDYAHYVGSKKVSYEEALECNIDGQYSVLHNKVQMNKNDVAAWIDYIDIQRPYMAKQECGDSKATILNTKAYYERVMEMLKQAIAANQSSAELYIKRLEIMENYLGITSDEVKKEWQTCENKFLNNTKMWKENLTMKQNDRTSFALQKMIELYDKAICKLVAVKDGIIRSHKMMEDTEEFLVDLLVGRCRLHIAAGYLDKAVAMLQALAEFHFFRPEKFDNMANEIKPKKRRELLLDEFKIFWETGVLRIGDLSAEGWSNLEDFNRDDEYELDQLGAEKLSIREDEDKEVENYKRKGLSLIEARRRLDKFRTSRYWKPVRLYDTENQHLGYYEYNSRKTSFDEIKHILFDFNNQKLPQDLIFKLLHIFGIYVPGMNFFTQEDILRTYCFKLFPSYRPNSLNLQGFDNFMQNFIRLLAESNRMDKQRILPTLASCISTSALKENEKVERLKKLVYCNTKQYMSDENVSSEEQVAIYMGALEEINKLSQSIDVKIKKEVNDGDGRNFVFRCFWKFLKSNLDDKNKSIWEIGTTSNTSEGTALLKEKRLKLFLLRWLITVIRNLPFSDDPNAYSDMIKMDAKDSTFKLKTKKELLLSIWLNGKVSEVEGTYENIKKAREMVSKRLKAGVPKDIDDLNNRWIGNEYEFTFELAALFCYEFPFQTDTHRYKFFLEEKPLFTSELAKSLSESLVVQEIRIRVLKHIADNSLEFTPSNLVKFIERMVIRFPHSIELLKTLLDVSSGFNQRIFLCKNPGKDKYTRFIRDCGRLYAEIRKFRFEVEKADANEYGDKEIITMLTHLIDIYKTIAERHSDNMIPDDYIWCFLMKIMIQGRDQISLSFQTINEIFTIGQKLCPWSKEFLFEAARGRPSSESSFLTTLNGLIGTHQLNSYCTDEEVELLMTHNIG